MKKHKLKAEIEMLEDKLTSMDKLYSSVKSDLHILATQRNSPEARHIIERIEQEIKLLEGKKTLLTMGNGIEPPKPKSILEGKVAIEVTNDREHSLLMKHFIEKGWMNTKEAMYLTPWPAFWRYDNLPFRPDVEWFRERQYTFVSFPAFAAEVGIEVPIFIIKSEDGVPLYAGDYAQVVSNVTTKTWEEGAWISLVDNGAGYAAVSDPEHNKLFSTTEAAKAWIAEQKKPKEVEVKLYNNRTAKVTASGILITKDEITFKIWPSDIEDITQALKSL